MITNEGHDPASYFKKKKKKKIQVFCHEGEFDFYLLNPLELKRPNSQKK